MITNKIPHPHSALAKKEKNIYPNPACLHIKYTIFASKQNVKIWGLKKIPPPHLSKVLEKNTPPFSVKTKIYSLP